MGAEITWFPPPPEGPRRVGAIRYGAGFRTSGARHAYDGCGVTQDWGDGVAVIGPLGSQVERGETRIARRRWRIVWRLMAWLLGRPPEFSRRDWTDILEQHRRQGFARVEFERHGRWYAVALAGGPPYRMRARLRS